MGRLLVQYGGYFNLSGVLHSGSEVLYHLSPPNRHSISGPHIVPSRNQLGLN